MSTNGTSAGASIYYGIKPVCVSPGKYCSFPFAGAAAATAIAPVTALAAARA